MKGYRDVKLLLARSSFPLCEGYECLLPGVSYGWKVHLPVKGDRFAAMGSIFFVYDC